MTAHQIALAARRHLRSTGIDPDALAVSEIVRHIETMAQEYPNSTLAWWVQNADDLEWLDAAEAALLQRRDS